jgi:hypothetical protein
MTATVTYLPGVPRPDELERLREVERERREAGRCTDPKCGELPPNHRWKCKLKGGTATDPPDAAA